MGIYVEFEKRDNGTLDLKLTAEGREELIYMMEQHGTEDDWYFLAEQKIWSYDDLNREQHGILWNDHIMLCELIEDEISHGGPYTWFFGDEVAMSGSFLIVEGDHTWWASLQPKGPDENDFYGPSGEFNCVEWFAEMYEYGIAEQAFKAAPYWYDHYYAMRSATHELLALGHLTLWAGPK